VPFRLLIRTHGAVVSRAYHPRRKHVVEMLRTRSLLLEESLVIFVELLLVLLGRLQRLGLAAFQREREMSATSMVD
jgi:hypothetical protein